MDSKEKAITDYFWTEFWGRCSQVDDLDPIRLLVLMKKKCDDQIDLELDRWSKGIIEDMRDGDNHE